ncbi:unnamed protein product [Pleuronectes platessa]|uniref:Uncharacterized protein n=1 Tax=Pleuronectes platessa TaxID=8262 RepID=A0A9N7VL55_PLEPL|nr:unnamed protein product [Pleuronectes platessa]
MHLEHASTVSGSGEHGKERDQVERRDRERHANKPTDTPRDKPRDTKRDKLRDTTRDKPRDTTRNKPRDTPKGPPRGKPTNPPRGTSCYTSRQFMLSVDRRVVNNQILTFITAILLMFGSYYCLNIHYPVDLASKLEFLQKHCIKTPERWEGATCWLLGHQGSALITSTSGFTSFGHKQPLSCPTSPRL